MYAFFVMARSLWKSKKHPVNLREHSFMKSTDLKQFDLRLLRRNLDQGVIKKEELDKYLKSLPDDSEQAESVNFEELDQGPEESGGISIVKDAPFEDNEDELNISKE